MNARERFLKTMNYEAVDRPPLLALEPFELVNLERWREEGLPEDQSPQEYLGMDTLRYVPLHLAPMPEYDFNHVMSEDSQYIIQLDSMGATVKRRKDCPSVYYGHIDHPVKNQKDWEKYKERFRPDFLSRIPGWGDELIRSLNESDQPVGFLLYPFFFRLGFYALGMERILMAFYDDSDLIHEMFSYWADYICILIQPILEVVQIDFVLFAEDLAYKTSTHLSPGVYEKYWYPYQDKIITLLSKYNIPVICEWTAGNLNPYLPGLLEHGFNCTWPLESQATGMNPYTLRNTYGRRLLLGGNIAKEALVQGPSAIDREIERLIPRMIS